MTDRELIIKYLKKRIKRNTENREPLKLDTYHSRYFKGAIDADNQLLNILEGRSFQTLEELAGD